jgi:ElaB/YqjD/DUF883 family membrane-anchored ribosome-binding protein
MALSKAANDAKSSASEALSQLEMEQRLDDLKNEIASISKTLAAIGGQKVDDYRAGMERLAADAVSASLKAFDSARSEAVSIEESFEDHVRAHPLRSVGIAAGIGFLFALMSRR